MKKSLSRYYWRGFSVFNSTSAGANAYVLTIFNCLTAFSMLNASTTRILIYKMNFKKYAIKKGSRYVNPQTFFCGKEKRLPLCFANACY